MSSGMTGQTPCVTTSRWDQPAQPKSKAPTGCTPVNVNQTSAQNPAPGPPVSDGGEPGPQGGVEMAAAMAAKINAMLMAKGKLRTPPPLLSKVPHGVPASSNAVRHDETVVTEVDINDVPINCRNLLTKGKTQEEIRQCSGAVVSTKGHYMSDLEKGRGVERPLYLHVQGKSQDEVNKAVRRIKEIISEDVLRTAALLGGFQVPFMPPLTLYPQPPRNAERPHMQRGHSGNSSSSHGHRPAAPHSGSFVHAKIFVGLDQALPSFNVNEKVEGPGGTYLGHIQTETGARVFLRGKTSGYIEQASRRESFEPLYVYISHPNQTGLEAAKKLTESLLETVRAEHTRMVSIYTATGSTQPYPAHGYPPNSNYSSQGSWYNYPADGYTGGYAAYPGAPGYWSSANGAPSHSNLSTTPQSSQAMVQYPVCPRKPHPYLVQDPGSSDSAAADCSSTSPPQTGSPKRRFQEETQDKQASQLDSSPAEAPPPEKTPPPAFRAEEGIGAERMLMPPPPMPPAPPMPAAPATRKRPKEAAPPSLAPSIPPAPMGVPEEAGPKRSRVASDSSGLVPYGGDSSDEEEERTRSSKAANS